ncbi:MAG TPA: hypothetical protein VF297_28570 [Pyrinomonadaceae bacterium]
MALEDESTRECSEQTSTEAAVGEVAAESFFFHDREDIPTGQVDHTPIIITDGSASIEFAEDLYIPNAGNPNRRVSKDLHLVKVVANQEHSRADNPESVGNSCFPFVAGDLYEIEVTCARDGTQPNSFVVGGGPTVSPVIEFEHQTGQDYQKNKTTFPPIQLGQRFGNVQRNISRLQIFRIEDGMRVRVHDCRLAPRQGCQYTILDIH